MRIATRKPTSPTLARFLRDDRGSFAVVYIVASLAVTTAVGMSVDVARLYNAKAKLDNAVDAAVLSTARALTEGATSEDDARKAIAKFLRANYDPAAFMGAPVKIGAIGIDPVAKTLRVEASVDLPMTIMQIAGVTSSKVSSNAAALYENTKVEVAMALDVTGSMGEWVDGTGRTKIEALKDAAVLGVGELIPNAAAAKRVRVGLVPYAATVDASPVIDKIETTGTSTGCVYERTGSAYDTDAFANYGNPVGGTTWYCPGAKIMPLTSDKTKLENHIRSFAIGGCTAGHTAIAWSYYMLSSKWNPAWPAGSDAAAPGDTNTRKYAIIMTDGVFNTHISSGQVCNENGKNASRQYALDLCKAMKDDAITVYTIAFAAPSDAEQMMRKCANAKDGTRQFAFDAKSEADLKAAFVAIARDIESLRLTN